MFQRSCSVALQLIGPFGLAVAGRSPGIALSSKKARACLAYLALRPQFSASREQLADLLWSNRHDAAARHSLRQCLVTLNKELEPFAPGLLSTDGTMVRLNSVGLTVDAREFARLAEQCRVKFDERALRAPAGEFLDRLVLDSEPFNAWLDEQRHQLHGLRATVLEAATAHFTRARNAPAAIEAAERLCALDPAREDWRRQLLRFYADARGREYAIAYARAWVSNHKREFDAEPDAATVALIDEIKGRPEDKPRISLPPPEAAELATLVPDLEATELVAPPPERHRSGPPRQPQSLPPETTPGTGAIATPQVPPRPSYRQASTMRARVMALAGGVLAIVLLMAAIVTVWWPTPTATEAGPPSEVASYVIVDLQAASAANGTGPPVVQTCESLARNLGRQPNVRIVSARGGTSRIADAFRMECKAAVGGEALSIALFDNTNGVLVWDGDLALAEAPEADVDRLRGIAREMATALAQADARRPPRAENDGMDLIRRGRAAQFLSPSMQKFERGLRYYEQALARDPNSHAAAVGVASLLVAARSSTLSDEPENLARAEQLLLRVLRDDPNSIAAHFAYAMLLKDLGRYELAVRAFRHVLELSPGYPPAYAQLGHSLMLQGAHEEGLALIRRAIGMSPNDKLMPVWRVFAGEAELELGRTGEAIDCFLSAVTLAPDYVRARGWLVAAYRIAGDTAAVRRHLPEFRKRLPERSSADFEASLRRTPEAGLGDSRPQLLRGLQLVLAAGS